MVAYNFKKEFAPKVALQEKLTTIRAVGKRRHVRPGEKVQLYTGQRTKDCYKLTTDPTCVFALPVVIRDEAKPVQVVKQWDTAFLGPLETVMIPWSQQAIARLDGFDSVDELRDFFTGRFEQPMVMPRWTFFDVPELVLPRLVACWDTWDVKDGTEFSPNNTLQEKSFNRRWCNNCVNAEDSGGCPIFTDHVERFATHDLWVYITSCPCCLAFELQEESHG